MDMTPASDQAPPLDPAAVLSSIGEAVYDWDVQSDTLRWTSGAQRLLRRVDPLMLITGAAYDGGISSRSGIGRTAHILGSRRIDDGMGVAYALRYALLTADGALLWLEDTGRWFAGADGRPAAAHGVVRQIDAPAEREAAQREIDPLTGQLTQSAFLAHANRLIADPKRHGHSAAAVVALDGLARINRDHGFETGTLAIGLIARRLAAVLRRADPVARIGGDRFMVLLSPCDLTALPALATRFSEAVSAHAIPTPDGPVPVSVRVAMQPIDASLRDGNHLLRRLDEMIDNRVAAPQPVTPAAPPLTNGALPDLAETLNGGHLMLAYQPIAEAAGENIVLHEALARIRLDDGRMLGAAAIVPAAERLGLLPRLDRHVLKLGFAALRRHPTANLALNVAAPSLTDPAWLRRLETMLAAAPSAGSRLTIEITETAAIADFTAACHTVARLKELGMRVAIDDFGAGHTSFRILRDLGVDIVKIDGAFVQNLTRSPDDRFFVRTLIDLARHRDMKIVAEWVRDEEAARMLRDWGADYLQGEYIGMPVAELPHETEGP
jgi:diguanylate cyclase (GGDEF)-like protein